MCSPKPSPQKQAKVRHSGLYFDTQRTSFHLSCSQEEQRAAAFLALTGETIEQPPSADCQTREHPSQEENRAAAFLALTGEDDEPPLTRSRQNKENPIDRSHSKSMKTQSKYEFEDSPSKERERNRLSQYVEDWVDGVSQSIQTFETAPQSPTTEMMINAAIRLNRDERHMATDNREVQKPKVEWKPLGEYTMSSKVRKPLGKYTMSSKVSSSQKASSPRAAYDSLSSVTTEPAQVTIRGDVQHQHHHHHHFHGTSAAPSRKNGEVWISRNNTGQLQYERMSYSQRRNPQKQNESSVSAVTVAKASSGCHVM